jgi:hypothetical protein
MQFRLSLAFTALFVPMIGNAQISESLTNVARSLEEMATAVSEKGTPKGREGTVTAYIIARVDPTALDNILKEWADSGFIQSEATFERATLPQYYELYTFKNITRAQATTLENTLKNEFKGQKTLPIQFNNVSIVNIVDLYADFLPGYPINLIVGKAVREEGIAGFTNKKIKIGTLVGFELNITPERLTEFVNNLKLFQLNVNNINLIIEGAEGRSETKSLWAYH